MRNRNRADDGLDALLQSKRLLQRELDRSHETMNLLYESHTRLHQSRDSLQLQSRLMGRASALLRSIQRRQDLERVLLFVACLVFFFVCGVIIARRLLGPWLMFFQSVPTPSYQQQPSPPSSGHS